MQLAGPKTIRWTREDYYKMAEAGLFEGRRVELIRGEIFEMTPQLSPHAAAVRIADYTLRPVFGHGYVISIQLPLSLGLDSDPEPDLAVVPGAPRDFVGAHPSTAVLVLEVADSSLGYDRITKGSLYAEANIQEYWILNLADRQLEVYREPRQEATGTYAYGNVTTLGESDTVSPLSAPGATIRVGDLLP